jgi:hypothetical protein
VKHGAGATAIAAVMALRKPHDRCNEKYREIKTIEKAYNRALPGEQRMQFRDNRFPANKAKYQNNPFVPMPSVVS